MSLNEEDHQKLFAWLLNEAEKIDLVDLDPTVFANYVRSLVIRNVSKTKITKGLYDFLGKNKAKQFANELKRRIKENDFSIQISTQENEEKNSDLIEDDKKEKTNEENKEIEESSEYSGSSYTESEYSEEFQNEEDRENIETEKNEDQIDDESSKKPQYLQHVSLNEPGIKPKLPTERFIIFVAGLQKEHFSIYKIYKLFHTFGRITAIQYDNENGVYFIEYLKLSYAYRAVKKGPKLIGNSLARVEFAKEPNSEAINAIEKEIEQHREDWETAQEDIELQKLVPKIVVSAIDAKKNFENEIEEMINRMKKIHSVLFEDQTEEREILEIQINRLLKELEKNPSS